MQGEENLITRYNRVWQSENCDVYANILCWRIIKVKIIFEEMGGTYTEVNGYLIPNLTLPTEKERPKIQCFGRKQSRPFC